MTSWLGVSNILQRLGKSSGQLHSSPSESTIIIIVIIRIDLTIVIRITIVSIIGGHFYSYWKY